MLAGTVDESASSISSSNSMADSFKGLELKERQQEDSICMTAQQSAAPMCQGETVSHGNRGLLGIA